MKQNNAPKNKLATTDDPLCLQMQTNLINAGKFMTELEATDSLLAYFHDPTTPDPNLKSHIYGHTFGLNKLRQFLFNIDLYNSNIEDDEERLYGVRIYYGISKRSDPDFPLDPPNGDFRDVFFMPVLKDGRDLYTIKTLTDPGLILGNSRPCPNQCSTKLHFI